MMILGHIHTYNSAAVIDQSVRALLNQTRPLDEILLVDNASTDATLRRSFPAQVTVIRQDENRGACGAIITGFQYALAKGYDWIWLFDADSAPRADALAKLLELYLGFSPELQTQTWVLASLPIEKATQLPRHATVLTPQGAQQVRPAAPETPYECDVTIWSGSLYKLAAVQIVGLPCRDYFMDGGEYEYGYRGKQRGYRCFTHQGSILDHNIDSKSSVRSGRLGPLPFKVVNFTPMRSYYIFRNSCYFWLYVFEGGSLSHNMPIICQFFLTTRVFAVRL